MKLEILLSCMHQNDASIIHRTCIQGNVLMVNQCDYDSKEQFELKNKDGVICSARIINTKERGLSKSRNMALKNAKGDICLICDDDEILYEDYEKKIIQAFVDNPEAAVIAFQIDDTGKTYFTKKKKLNYLTSLKIASWQIAFRRQCIITNKIQFDEAFGSGISKAGGEENIFLYDCLHNKLKLLFVPISIGRMVIGASQWFNGFTKEYFYDRGVFTCKLMGKFFALIYAVYFLILKYKLYKQDISVAMAVKSLFKGIFKR